MEELRGGKVYIQRLADGTSTLGGCPDAVKVCYKHDRNGEVISEGAYNRRNSKYRDSKVILVGYCDSKTSGYTIFCTIRPFSVGEGVGNRTQSPLTVVTRDMATYNWP